MKWNQKICFLMQSTQMKKKMSNSIKNIKCFLKYKIVLQFLHKIIKMTEKHFNRKIGLFFVFLFHALQFYRETF